MSAGPVDPFVLYDIKSSTIRGGELTNLPLMASTWGKFIPSSWGNARVAGEQIWSSGFYANITRSTYTVSKDNNYQSPYGENLDKYGAVVGGNSFQREFSSPAIDIAWAFGYNGDLGAKRKVQRIRFDGAVIYDAATGAGDPNYSFTIRYGDEKTPEPIMVAGEANADDVLYYPGMIVITFANMTKKLPLTVDIDLAASSIPTVTGLIRTDITSTFAFQSSEDQHFADYKNGVFYRYRPSLGGNGSFEQWDLATYTLKKTTAINLALPSSFATDKLGPIQWISSAGLCLAQHKGPDGTGFSAVYLIDPNTGVILKKFGESGYTFSTPKGSGIPFCLTVCQVYDKMTVGPGEGYGIGFSNDANFRTFTIGAQYQNAQEGWSVYGFERAKGIGRIPDATAPGKEGVGYARFGTKFYKLNFDGINNFIDVPYTIENSSRGKFMGVVGRDLVTAHDLTVWRYSELGNKAYETVTPRPDTGTVVDYYDTYPNVLALQLRSSYGTSASGYWGNPFNYVMDFATGEVKFTRVTGGSADLKGIGIFFNTDTGAFNSIRVGSGTTNSIYTVPVVTFGGKIKLRDFMRSLYVNTGKYTAAQIIFEGIDDEVSGALMTKAYKIGDVIDNVCRLWRIEKIETPTQIKFYRNRTFFDPAAIAFTINVDDLALVNENGEERAAIVTTVRNPEQSAASIKLTYIDAAAGFVENTVEWRRPDAPADATTTVSIAVPIVMTKAEALILVQVQYTDTLASTTSHRLRLPQSYSNVSSGDLIKIVGRNYTDVVRLVTCDLRADQSVQCETETVVTQAHVPFIVTDVPGTSRPDKIGSGNTIVMLFNVPALVFDQNAAVGNFVDYAIAYGDGSNYRSGYVARKKPGGDWTQLFEITRGVKFAIYRTKNALADVRHLIDRSTLDLEYLGGTWTADQNTDETGIIMDARKNITLYGAGDRWEVMQTAAIDLATNKATGFARGMRGSEGNCAAHVVGDLLIVLYAFVVREERPNTDRDKQELYRGVSGAQVFDKQADTAFTPRGTSLRPFAPWNVQATRNAGTSAVLFTWLRRDRAAPTRPGTDAVVNSEASLTFEIDIHSSSGAVVRTMSGSAVDSTNMQASYTLGMQQADGLASAKQLTVTVYQMSSVIGRGFGNRVTVNVN